MKHSIAPQRLNVLFDDRSLIANAGMLPAVLMLQRLGIGELADARLTLGDPAANPNRSDKLLSLICSSLAGGDCIDDADVLRAGDTARILGFRVKAPSTLGTFLRSFRWHNVRQLDAISRIALKRAWSMGAVPGEGPLTIDVDSTLCETYGSHKQGALKPGYTGEKGYHPLVASIGGSGEILHVRMREGRAYTGRGAARFVAEAISRARYAGASGPITVRADAGFYSDEFTAACRRAGARFSVTGRNQRGAFDGFARIARERDWVPIPDYEGAYAAEAAYTPFAGQGNRIKVRLIMRRVPLYMGPLLEDQSRYRYHYFVTDRAGDLLYLEKDHRRHAEVEGAIRDLKYGMGLNHFPSGNFGANAAWLWIQALAHNVCRWLRQIGDPRQGVLTAATLRRRIIAVPSPARVAAACCICPATGPGRGCLTGSWVGCRQSPHPSEVRRPQAAADTP